MVSMNRSKSLVFANLEGILSADLKPDDVFTISIAFGGSRMDQFTEKSGAFLARRSVWVRVGANIGRAIRYNPVVDGSELKSRSEQRSSRENIARLK